MFRQWLFIIGCLLLLALPVSAQDLPEEIDDHDGDWQEVIAQLAEDGYIDDNRGELVVEENRVRFERDFELFLDLGGGDLTNFVMAGVLQIDDFIIEDDEPVYAFCGLGYRSEVNGGLGAAGVTSFGTVDLYDLTEDDNGDALIDFEFHDQEADDEVHLIIIALEDEITVYVDGELFFEEDDLSVREGELTLVRTDTVDCDLDDLWVWEMDTSTERALGSKGNDDESDDDEAIASSLPEEIDDYDGSSIGVINQFEESGVIGSGNSFLFDEDYAFISASGSTFFPLGRGRNRQDVILGGQITFESFSNEFEDCGILLRVDDTQDPAEDFLFVGTDDDGNLLVIDNSGSQRTNAQEYDVNLDDAFHLIVVARGDRLAIYVDGELTVENLRIYETRGIFGIAQFTDSVDSSCEVRDMWVYDTPFFEAGVCTVLASGNVNQRSGPSTSTDIAGQLRSGETVEVIAQTHPGDGFTWYELEDGSFVREDIISLVGDCNDLDEN